MEQRSLADSAYTRLPVENVRLSVAITCQATLDHGRWRYVDGPIEVRFPRSLQIISLATGRSAKEIVTIRSLRDTPAVQHHSVASGIGHDNGAAFDSEPAFGNPPGRIARARRPNLRPYITNFCLLDSFSLSRERLPSHTADPDCARRLPQALSSSLSSACHALGWP
jgi:hypothetical protein